MENVENIANEEMFEELTAEEMTEASGGAYRPLAPKEGYYVYQIQYRDVLIRIAKRFNTTVRKIVKANPKIKDANLIHTGYYIYIPMN